VSHDDDVIIPACIDRCKEMSVGYDIRPLDCLEACLATRLTADRSPSTFRKVSRDPANWKDSDEKRAGSFVRIGRMYPEFNPEATNERQESWADNADDLLVDGVNKRVSSFVRIGKVFPTDKRYYQSDPRKRVSSFVRIGKSLGGNDDQWASGKNLKRASSFVRIGRSESDRVDDAEKRMSSFVRIGKMAWKPGQDGEDISHLEDASLEDREANKRAGSFVRIGKSLTAEDEELNETSADKRVSSFVRIGRGDPMSPEKRVSSFVRIGKKSEDTQPLMENEDTKRVSSFVRIGKSPEQEVKRMSSFVRIGKGESK